MKQSVNVTNGWRSLHSVHVYQLMILQQNPGSVMVTFLINVISIK